MAIKLGEYIGSVPTGSSSDANRTTVKKIFQNQSVKKYDLFIYSITTSNNKCWLMHMN